MNFQEVQELVYKKTGKMPSRKWLAAFAGIHPDHLVLDSIPLSAQIALAHLAEKLENDELQPVFSKWRRNPTAQNYYLELVKARGEHPSCDYLMRHFGVSRSTAKYWRMGRQPSTPYHQRFKELISKETLVKKGKTISKSQKIKASHGKTRKCLSCDSLFMSFGSYNRLCSSCKRNNEENFSGTLCNGDTL